MFKKKVRKEKSSAERCMLDVAAEISDARDEVA